jgi:thymidine phosphorylase
MNQPLGNSAGLWCEVRESMECLQGNGPDDLMAVVYHLGKSALEIAGIENPEEKLKSNIENGKALEKFNEMVDAHGGAFESIADSSIHAPKYKKIIIAKDDGFITHLNTLELGKAVVQLGGGRLAIGDKLDYSTGIQFYKKIGQTVSKGETLAEVFCSNIGKLEIGYSMVCNAYRIEKNISTSLQLIY